jgi:N-acetyl-anhydromuramoyl-L-alanine amidase
MELTIDDEGRVPQATQLASPNCDERPPGIAIELIVIHNISLPPGEYGGDAIERLFANTLDYGAHPYYAGLRGLRVSSHFLIRRDGALLQFVPCAMRAWHAGASSWRGREACNDFSIGIELEGSDAEPFTEPQYAALDSLLKALQARFPIAGIAGHSEIAPSRKTDPGPFFDWLRVRDT